MDQLLLAIEQALANQSWHAALALSLTLPDICGKIDFIAAGTQFQPNRGIDRYSKWFDTYVMPQYRIPASTFIPERIFLSGRDCYVLRCAYLHEGGNNVTGQEARGTIESFHFVVSPPGSVLHNNRSNNRLQLDVEVFCTDVINGVRAWLLTNPAIPFSNMLTVQVLDDIKDFRSH